MSESRESKRLYIQRMAFIRAFEYWHKCEQPMIRFRVWRKWLKNRPVLQDYYKKGLPDM
jgi:hypothetical protein